MKKYKNFVYIFIIKNLVTAILQAEQFRIAAGRVDGVASSFRTRAWIAWTEQHIRRSKKNDLICVENKYKY